MRKGLTMMGVVGGMLLGGEALAQGPATYAIEARGAFAVPHGEWGEGLGSGFGFGANAQANFGVLGVYAGWERFVFALDETELGEVEGNASDAGLRAGITVTLPNRSGGISPYLQGGVISNQTTFTFGDGEAAAEFESDRSIGLELAGGLNIPLGPTLSFTPAVRYRSHSAEFDAFAELGDEEMVVQYFVVDLGLRFGFGR